MANNKNTKRASSAKGVRRNAGTTPEPLGLMARLRSIKREEVAEYFK